MEYLEPRPHCYISLEGQTHLQLVPSTLVSMHPLRGRNKRADGLNTPGENIWEVCLRCCSVTQIRFRLGEMINIYKQRHCRNTREFVAAVNMRQFINLLTYT